MAQLTWHWTKIQKVDLDLRTFQFVTNFTPLDILLGTLNYDNGVMYLNAVALFATYYISNLRTMACQLTFTVFR